MDRANALLTYAGTDPSNEASNTQDQKMMFPLSRYDGSFLQFRCDEKGFLGICALGLPGHTHEDDSSRGIQAALELRLKVQEGGHRTCVGVTTGRLLCTCVGAHKIRSEYTVSDGGHSVHGEPEAISPAVFPLQVFGDAINLSARLMVKCQKGAAEILCDEATYSNAKYMAMFTPLEPMCLKVRTVQGEIRFHDIIY